jgi:hypothetical protein
MKPPFLSTKSNEDLIMKNIHDTGIYLHHELGPAGQKDVRALKRLEGLASITLWVAFAALALGLVMLAHDYQVEAAVSFVGFTSFALISVYLRLSSHTSEYHEVVIDDLKRLSQMLYMRVDVLCALDPEKITPLVQKLAVEKASRILQLEEAIRELKDSDLSEQTRYQLNEASDQMKEQLKLALNEDCRILDVFAMGDWTRGKAFEVAKAQREAAKKPGVHQVAPSA